MQYRDVLRLVDGVYWMSPVLLEQMLTYGSEYIRLHPWSANASQTGLILSIQFVLEPLEAAIRRRNAADAIVTPARQGISNNRSYRPKSGVPVYPELRFTYKRRHLT
jgi:hypothetical protein